MKPTISVIVPIYNVEKYLEECLLSIQTQTYTQLQVILIDDGSTDKSAQIAQTFVDSDTRFQLIRQANAGQSAARNKGIEHAMGEYISFVDADDYIALDFYATLIKKIQDNDVLQFGYTRINQQGQILHTRTPRFLHQYTTPWSRLFRTEFIRRANVRFEEGFIYEDMLFSIDIWNLNPTYSVVNYTGYYYRTNPTSTTSKKHDTRPIFRLIKTRKNGATLRQKLLINYTLLRLRLHFLLNR